VADDPMTVDTSEKITLREGLAIWRLKCSGPADYDATNGSAFDVSSYVSKIWSCDFNAVTAKGDALAIATYVNDDFDDADGGAVYFTWDTANSGDAENARLLSNVADQTDLSGYQWLVTLIGAPA
jgi:hypothetical protein